MTSLATAVGGMKHWDWCPICRSGLDTGLECDQCGADLMPIYTALKESLSVGNHGEPNACTGAEERGISGATGAGQLPDGNPESTGDSADRRSPGGTERTPSPDESHRHFERGCHIIMELMQAYERRVRSDCTTQEQIDKRPWECAEYIKAAEYLRKVWPPHEPQPSEARGDDLAGWLEEMHDYARPIDQPKLMQAAALLRSSHEPGEICAWAYVDDGSWLTNCGESAILENGGTAYSDMRFCCFCGKPTP